MRIENNEYNWIDFFHFGVYDGGVAIQRYSILAIGFSNLNSLKRFSLAFFTWVANASSITFGSNNSLIFFLSWAEQNRDQMEFRV